VDAASSVQVSIHRLVTSFGGIYKTSAAKKVEDVLDIFGQQPFFTLNT
jgi:hypothetical protein